MHLIRRICFWTTLQIFLVLDRKHFGWKSENKKRQKNSSKKLLSLKMANKKSNFDKTAKNHSPKFFHTLFDYDEEF